MPPSIRMVSVPPNVLESIAFNLCSLHDFDPAFVQQNERFALATITEYLRAQPAAAPVREEGGAVSNDDAPTYKRLAHAMSGHSETMVVERSDPTLELTAQSLEDALEEVLPLATPTAPEAEKLRGAMPDLSHVIAWLRNGCEVKHAITELEVYQARIVKALSASAAVARASEQG